MEETINYVNRALEACKVPPADTMKERLGALDVGEFAVVGRVMLAMIYGDLPL